MVCESFYLQDVAQDEDQDGWDNENQTVCGEKAKIVRCWGNACEIKKVSQFVFSIFYRGNNVKAT